MSQFLCLSWGGVPSFWPEVTLPRFCVGIIAAASWGDTYSFRSPLKGVTTLSPRLCCILSSSLSRSSPVAKWRGDEEVTRKDMFVSDAGQLGWASVEVCRPSYILLLTSECTLSHPCTRISGATATEVCIMLSGCRLSHTIANSLSAPCHTQSRQDGITASPFDILENWGPGRPGVAQGHTTKQWLSWGLPS